MIVMAPLMKGSKTHFISMQMEMVLVLIRRAYSPAEIPEGYADNRFDCDDVLPEFNPDAEEICDDLDNDCDGASDEGLNQIFLYRC